MTRRRPRFPNLPVWLFALLLLLRAAMPLLASASANVQGVALGEICSVHGVVLASAAQEPRDPLQAPAGDPAAHHCVLGALGALGTAGPPLAVFLTVSADFRTALQGDASPPWPDAAATWVARQKHGPPPAA